MKIESSNLNQQFQSANCVHECDESFRQISTKNLNLNKGVNLVISLFLFYLNE